MAMIEFNKVNKYYGDFHVLKDIDFKIDQGEVVVIVGPSGSGKSTLIRTINALEEIQGGHLIVNGVDISDKKTDLDALRRDIGMVFQHFNLYANKTVLENVMLAPRIVLKRDEKENEENAMKYLALVGLTSKINAKPHELSGGQKQRAAIARALAMEPKVMLFDEPTSALDPEMIGDILNIIKDIIETTDMTIVTVTHEMDFAREVADRVIFIDEGAIIEDDSAENFYNHPTQKRAQQFLSRVLTHS
ncbi:amino acid ABC transporter ATP-binding protein [Ligilactobacillus pobuzihii]|uniref:Glutamine transport ATP-binding protein n=1 Tax=Ligilactobacillus pobuzihii TaxID=449659 RepID=A0A0R2LL90_9LACO|nr:amino acid ABC transporter ATP-binding protein [Ligilactobacillus pobuzihii]KRK09005.1 glutamine transport ATP-binding protein [Ligilactobacillus pobuzihii E100301 = KCTC 13174]KRO00128.1 glutamine transport ATP-binding protein [Ligilactobacillus pobuzihii]GEN49295.1 glutamine ABC transporter ATP-binding protein [Ligilactobacillus pobuzihii]